MKTIEERTKAIDDAELLNLKSSQGNYRTMLEKLKEYLSTASQEDLDAKYNELSEFLSNEPVTTIYDEAGYKQGYHDAIGKAAEVFSEMLVELWPDLLGYGGIAKKLENDFRKRLEE